MLTYSYECKECGGLFDLSVKSKEEFLDARPKCPSCGSVSVRRANPAPYHASLTAGKSRMDAKYPYVSRRLPRNVFRNCRHTKDGKPIIESKAHEREIMAGAGNGERYERE